MDSRQRLLDTLAFRRGVSPPRFEAEFSDEVVRKWTEQGHLDGRGPEAFFGFDARESPPIAWGRTRDDKHVVMDEGDLAGFRRVYDADDPKRAPGGWRDKVEAWRGTGVIVWDSPWDEGFFQVIGIREAVSFTRALTNVCEQPELAEAQMDYYASFLETLIDRVLQDTQLDYAVFYEPIASNSAPVISPGMYRQFALPALRRVVARLADHGMQHFFVWTAGHVRPMVPVWREAGINGLLITQCGAAGLSYRKLRAEFGADLRFFGGIDWRVMLEGGKALETYFEREVRPLIKEGGYVPHLDDRVREYVPFETFRRYRERLDKLIGENG